MRRSPACVSRCRCPMSHQSGTRLPPSVLSRAASEVWMCRPWMCGLAVRVADAPPMWIHTRRVGDGGAGRCRWWRPWMYGFSAYGERGQCCRRFSNSREREKAPSCHSDPRHSGCGCGCASGMHEREDREDGGEKKAASVLTSSRSSSTWLERVAPSRIRPRFRRPTPDARPATTDGRRDRAWGIQLRSTHSLARTQAYSSSSHRGEDAQCGLRNAVPAHGGCASCGDDARVLDTSKLRRWYRRRGICLRGRKHGRWAGGELTPRAGGPRRRREERITIRARPIYMLPSPRSDLRRIGVWCSSPASRLALDDNSWRVRGTRRCAGDALPRLPLRPPLVRARYPDRARRQRAAGGGKADAMARHRRRSAIENRGLCVHDATDGK
ncbi:hypothetical protein C8R47DRAFT_401222 [Mycena vitilis]|nr:hypothetical protein C8R47DRAFT_401222 [Mycena vitilis]